MPENQRILHKYRHSGELPIPVFLHHGTYESGTTLLLADVLQEKRVPLHYIESHGGHAHGSWRATTDNMLVTFFGS